MRGILFRGKRIDNGGWAYSQTVFSHLDNFYIPTQNLKCTVMRNLDIVGNISEIRCKDGKCFFKVHPETIGQYTGLTDKNGKKIFEGDIIKICGQHSCFDKVEFLDGLAGFYAVNDDIHIPAELATLKKNFIEVIGNIHDNPEMLEVTE